MRTSWLTGFGLLFLAGMLISLTLEGEYIGTDETNVFYTALNPNFISFSNPLSAIAGFFVVVWSWVQALWALFWWDYSFLTGTWVILRYFGWSVSFAMVVSIVLAVRGTGSS